MKKKYTYNLFMMLLLSSFLLLGTLSGCNQAPSAIKNITNEEPTLQVDGSLSWIRHVNRSQPEEFLIPDEIQEMITDYLGVYHFSLAKLSEEDITSFFSQDSPESIKSALTNQAALHYLITLRNMLPHDMTIPEFRIILNPVSLTPFEEEDRESTPDLVTLTLYEHRYQHFSFASPIASSSTRIEHHFVIDVSSKEPVIYLHQKFEDADFLIREHFEQFFEPAEAEAFNQKLFVSNLNRSTEDLLVLAKSNLSNRKIALAEQNSDSENQTLLQATNDYNRQAAVAYAMEWVDPLKIKRNPEWYVYDDLGGNCNNFVSQSLFAGGIPMDTTGHIDSQWKWYDNRINSRQTERGRSPSWAGVNEFYKYVNSNTGSGMVATTQANYYDGELGDIILFGYNGRWKHAVIITGIIKDDDGRVIDYLINSNTADQILYPVSAYGYYEITLIKIIGFNE